jgi:hypothetical protein
MKKIPEGHTKLTLIFCLIKSDNDDVEKMRLYTFFLCKTDPWNHFQSGGVESFSEKGLTTKH